MSDEKDAMPNHLPTSPRFSREIALALLVKFVLLWGVWYLAFHIGKPAARPEIEDLFRQPRSQNPQVPTQAQENPNVIR